MIYNRLNDFEPKPKKLSTAHLTAAVEAVLALHPQSCEINGGSMCNWKDECPALVCGPCGDSWPCPTVAAIENALEGRP
jgi:hypothetical protein